MDASILEWLEGSKLQLDLKSLNGHFIILWLRCRSLQISGQAGKYVSWCYIENWVEPISFC